MEDQSTEKVAPMESKDEMDEEQRRLGNCLQQVLSNSLVSEIIASFLSLADMKAALEVSRQFFQAIRGTRRFAQEAVLVITDKNAQKATLEKTEYSWRGVRIDVRDSSVILDDLPRVLKSAEFVCLGAPPGKIINVRRKKDPAAARLLTTVLNSTPALTHFQIGTQFLLLDLRTVLSSPAVQQTLSNLNRLEVVTKNRTNCERDLELELWFLNSDEEDTFWRNFGLLTGLPNRLKCFKLTDLTPTEDKSVNSLRRPVLQLLKNNKATLEQLELHFNVWGIQELQTLTLPALKTLTASVNRDANLCSGRRLGEFLKNQRSLEELTLTSLWWVKPGDPLLTAVKEFSVRLRKLHFTALSFEELDWSFVASMNLNRLKDLQLRMRGGFEYGSSLLASLPKNQLQCLSLEGLRHYRYRPFGFWRLCGVENEFHFKTELLQGFRCLRTLSFVGSLDAVDDQLMQWLLKEFVSLEELKLSGCSKLTDAGISGNTTAEWGRDASFADLRRLTTLKIVKCGVTPNGILASCVNVPSLRSLEYSNPGPIVRSVVLKLASQNPRLERLSLDYVDYADDLEKLKAKVKMNNPRVELSLAEYD